VPRKPRDPTAPKMGRPTFDSIRAQQIEVIFDRVAAGETLETVCKDEGIPVPSEFHPGALGPPGGGPPRPGSWDPIARHGPPPHFPRARMRDYHTPDRVSSASHPLSRVQAQNPGPGPAPTMAGGLSPRPGVMGPIARGSLGDTNTRFYSDRR
jgi:hypothetical protein